VIVTADEIRQIVKEEVNRGLIMFLDAKITATAIENGLYYSDGSEPKPCLVPLHSKPHPRKRTS